MNPVTAKIKVQNSTMYTDVRLEGAENGLVLHYTEKVKKPSASEYENYDYNYKQKVYKFTEAQQAVDDLLELSGLSSLVNSGTSVVE